MNSILEYVHEITIEALGEKTEELMEKLHEEFIYEDVPNDTLFNVIHFVLFKEFVASFHEAYA